MLMAPIPIAFCKATEKGAENGDVGLEQQPRRSRFARPSIVYERFAVVRSPRSFRSSYSSMHSKQNKYYGIIAKIRRSGGALRRTIWTCKERAREPLTLLYARDDARGGRSKGSCLASRLRVPGMERALDIIFSLFPKLI